MTNLLFTVQFEFIWFNKWNYSLHNITLESVFSHYQTFSYNLPTMQLWSHNGPGHGLHEIVTPPAHRGVSQLPPSSPILILMFLYLEQFADLSKPLTGVYVS